MLVVEHGTGGMGVTCSRGDDEIACDTQSVWGDAPSWARMRGNAANTGRHVAG